MTEKEAWEKLIKARPDIADNLREWLKHNQGVRERNSKPLTLDDVTGDPQELVVVASPNHADISGSKQAVCACGTLVWLSPSTQEVMKRRGRAPTLVICGVCWAARVEKDAQEG